MAVVAVGWFEGRKLLRPSGPPFHPTAGSQLCCRNRLLPLPPPPMTVKVGSGPSWSNSALTSSGPRAAWRSPWSIAPTPGSSASWSSPCATRPTTWRPPPTRPVLRAGKKGVSGVQHRLPGLRPARQVHRLPQPHPADRQRRGGTEAGCKVLGGRLKGAGMHWCASASEQAATLAALYASGDGLWDAFWDQRRQKNYQRK